MTQTELELYLGSNAGKSRYRTEFILDWIKDEILYQKSIENDLLTKDNFERVIKNSERKLGASLAIKDYLKRNPTRYSDKELKSFYKTNRKDFSFSNEAFVLNYAAFDLEGKAIIFRNKAIIDGWQNSINSFKSDSSLITNIQQKIFKLANVQSKKINRVIKRLYKKEISPVVKTELNNFVVVQQVDKISKNTVPKFKYIRNNVEESFLVLKQREQIKNYLDSLISQKSVKIY